MDALVARAHTLAKETQGFCSKTSDQTGVANKMLDKVEASISSSKDSGDPDNKGMMDLSVMEEDASKLSSDAETLAGNLAESSDRAKNLVLTVCERTNALQAEDNESPSCQQDLWKNGKPVVGHLLFLPVFTSGIQPALAPAPGRDPGSVGYENQ